MSDLTTIYEFRQRLLSAAKIKSAASLLPWTYRLYLVFTVFYDSIRTWLSRIISFLMLAIVVALGVVFYQYRLEIALDYLPRVKSEAELFVALSILVLIGVLFFLSIVGLARKMDRSFGRDISPNSEAIINKATDKQIVAEMTELFELFRSEGLQAYLDPIGNPSLVRRPENEIPSIVWSRNRVFILIFLGTDSFATDAEFNKMKIKSIYFDEAEFLAKNDRSPDQTDTASEYEHEHFRGWSAVREAILTFDPKAEHGRIDKPAHVVRGMATTTDLYQFWRLVTHGVAFVIWV